MRRMSRIVALLLAAAVSLSVTASASALSIAFQQLDWLSDGGGYTAQNSEWGRFDLQLTPADFGIFTPTTGGYVAWLNVVTDTTSSGGTSNNRAVENLPLFLQSATDLDGQIPHTYTFDLGTARGVNVASLQAAVLFSAAPLITLPPFTFFGAAVGDSRYLVGGIDDAGVPVSGGTGQNAPAQAQNTRVPIPGTDLFISKSGKLQAKDSDIPAIDEDENGCAPGSAARSIKYLQLLNGFSLASTAQDVYEDLVDSMQTDTGEDGAGTTRGNFLSGKRDYTTDNSLPIDTVQTGRTTSDFCNIIDQLNQGADVEAMIFWGRNENNESMGGHAALVTQVQKVVDENGNVVGFVVTIMDDEEQGDGEASNTKHELVFDKDGNLLGHGTGARLIGFQVETVPEPTTLGMIGLLSAAALLRRPRRCA